MHYKMYDPDNPRLSIDVDMDGGGVTRLLFAPRKRQLTELRSRLRTIRGKLTDTCCV